MNQARTPAQCVLDAFGGIHATARAINAEREAAGKKPIHFTTVSCWVNRRPKGLIPQRWHPWILRAAQTQRLDISLDDLLFEDE